MIATGSPFSTPRSISAAATCWVCSHVSRQLIVDHVSPSGTSNLSEKAGASPNLSAAWRTVAGMCRPRMRAS